MVLHILKHEGEGVGAGNGLMELGQVARMEALAEVFETSIRYVKAGQRATFESPALAHPVKGRVLRIVPKVNRVSLYSTEPTGTPRGAECGSSLRSLTIPPFAR